MTCGRNLTQPVGSHHVTGLADQPLKAPGGRDVVPRHLLADPDLSDPRWRQRGGAERYSRAARQSNIALEGEPITMTITAAFEQIPLSMLRDPWDRPHHRHGDDSRSTAHHL